MDLSRVSDELLDRAIAQLDAGQPTGIPLEEQAALRAEWSRRRSGAPDNVTANLDAAATPITPDPAVKPRQIDPPAATSPGDLRTRMIEAGYTPAEADVAVRQEATMPNANMWPPSDATLREGAAYVRGQDRRTGAFDQSLANAMGHNDAPVDVTGPDMVMVDGVAVPAHRLSDGQPFGGMYTLGAMRRAEEATDEAFRSAGGRHGVPGPRTSDGRDPSPAPEFSSPAEAEAYFTRPRDPSTGQLMPSKADMAMEQRAFVPTYGPDGEAHYQMGFSVARGGGPDVRRNLDQYLTHNVPGTGLPAWALANAEGPTGKFRAMVPTQANREYNQQIREDQSIGRIADQTGKTREEIQKMTPRERANLLQDVRLAEKRKRRELFNDSARLARGSNNINSANGAFFNALAMLEGVNPDRMTAQQRAMVQMMPMDPIRAQVEGRQLEQAARWAGDVVTGALAGQGQIGQADKMRREQRMENLRQVARQAYNSAAPSRRRQAVNDALIGEVTTPEERAEILGNLFPDEGDVPPRGPAGPAPGSSTLPNGAPRATWPVNTL